MGFLLLPGIIFAIGVGVSVWIFFPSIDPGKKTFTIYRPKRAKRIEVERLSPEAFEKMNFSEIRFCRKVSGKGVTFYYYGTSDGKNFFETERHYRHDTHKLVTSSLSGKRLMIETIIDWGEFCSNLSYGVLISLGVSVFLGIFVAIIWELFTNPYGW